MFKKKIVWVEKLGFIEVLILFIQRIFSNIEIRYDENQISCLARRLLILGNKIRENMMFYPAGLTLEGKDPEGYALNYRVQKNLDLCLEGFCRKYISNESDDFKRLTKSYLGSRISNRLVFITMVEALVDKIPDIKHELYIIRFPENSLFLSFYNKKGGMKIKQSFSFKEYLRIIVIPFYYILISLSTKLFGMNVKGNVDTSKPAVWVEYENILINSKRSFSFWVDFVKAEQYELVYYLDRIDTPMTEDNLSRIQKKGFKWLDCKNIHKIGKLNLSDVNKFMLSLFFLKHKQPVWFIFFRLRFFILLSLYCFIYSYFKVKIIIQHQEASWIQAVQAKAIESSGGIMMGFNWSNYPYYLEPTLIYPQHVYFVWGKIHYEMMRKKAEICRFILPGGLWIMPDDERPFEIEDFTNRFNFIITLFDSGGAYNAHRSVETVSKFYLNILCLLENNTSWGGIIKSKKMSNLDDFTMLPHGEEIALKINKLMEQERLMFLHFIVSPVTASSFANLSVCMGLNSAGIIAGIYGHRAIHHDSSGWLHHPLHKDPKQKIIYLSFDEFENAIINASVGDKSIGDFSRWRKDFNYFDDLRAPERIGRFIQSFMDEIIMTEDLETSLSHTVTNYISENKITNNFFEVDNLWEDEITRDILEAG